ncbi:MAG: hypothetical protein ABMA64_06660 [Myxococcota bacterium]
MAEEPQRPPGLPVAARWIAERGEFLVCAQVDGLDHGPARYHRPDGTLACESQLVYGVSHGPYQRFHPDGTWSQRGEMRHGLRHGEIRWRRSDSPTPEHTVPEVCPPEIREVWTPFVDGVPCPARFFDAAGVERLHTGAPVPERPSTVRPDAAFDVESRLWFHGIGSQRVTERHGWWRWWDEAGALRYERRYWRGAELESRIYDPSQVERQLRAGSYSVVTQRRIGVPSDHRDVDQAGQPIPDRPAGVPEQAQHDLESGGWVEGPGVDWVPSEEISVEPCNGRFVWWSEGGVSHRERVFVDGKRVYERSFSSDGRPMVDRVHDLAGNELSVTWWNHDRPRSRTDSSYDEHGLWARTSAPSAAGRPVRPATAKGCAGRSVGRGSWRRRAGWWTAGRWGTGPGWRVTRGTRWTSTGRSRRTWTSTSTRAGSSALRCGSGRVAARGSTCCKGWTRSTGARWRAPTPSR